MNRSSFLARCALLLVGVVSLVPLVACGGNEDSDDSGGGTQDVKNAPSTSPTQKAPGAATRGPLSGPGFTPREVVVVFDENGEGKPRARVVASTEGDLCKRINDGLETVAGEKVVSAWVEATKFTIGKTTLTDAENRTAGTSFLDEKVMCRGESSAEPNRGKGTIEITSTDGTVKGTLDLTFNGLSVSGSFEATTCAKKVLGVMHCPDLGTVDPGQPDS